MFAPWCVIGAVRYLAAKACSGELDERREVGIVIRQRKIVNEIARLFGADWNRRERVIVVH
jgi:hypothetical protein